LALVLVILSLGATLAMLVTGEATDLSSSALAELGERARSALATVLERARAMPDSRASNGIDRALADTDKTPAHNVAAPDRIRPDPPAPLPGNTSSDRSQATIPGSDRARENTGQPDAADTVARPERKSPPAAEIRLTSATTESRDDRARFGGSTEIEELYIRNQDITTVLELLSRKAQRNIVASRNVKGSLSITLYHTTVDAALAAILKMQGLVARQEGEYLRVYTPEDLEEAEAQAGKIEIRVYKPRYISANDLVGILTVHLSARGKISSTKANQVGIATSSDNAGGDNLAVEDAIIIQDVESVLTRIEEIIRHVDVRPPQVLIEATVLKVELSNTNQMGVNFAALGIGNAGQALAVSGQGTLLNNSAGFKPAILVDALGKIQGDGFLDNEHGLKFGVVGGDLTAFVRLLETVGHTTLVASPKVLALNKQRAEFIVGAQLGYRTVTTTETAAVENIQFLEVGTQLRLRPFVQPDGMIRLELHPEKSSGQINPETQLPEKQTTQVTTNLTVPNGSTVVIGGLIEEQQDRQVKQVPFLGSLPLVGSLFRDETTSTRRSEIIVLITPRIVDEGAWDCESRRELDAFEASRDAVERSFPPYTRIALARQHYETACRYRDRGKIAMARAHAELAVHYDPTDDAAVRLRDELNWTTLSVDAEEPLPGIDRALTAPPAAPPSIWGSSARKGRQEPTRR
jgi:type IV pilus assembly protein PilQ